MAYHRLRSHEEGDQYDIPDVYFDSKLLDPRESGESIPFIHWALAASRTQGFRASPELDYDRPQLLSIAGRLETFGQNWQGPRAWTMATAGLFRSHTLKASCPFCRMDFKGWKSGEDPWQRHTFLSPKCRYLKRQKRACEAIDLHTCMTFDLVCSEWELQDYVILTRRFMN